MGTHKICSGIQGTRDSISGSLYGDCHELLARLQRRSDNVVIFKIYKSPSNSFKLTKI